MDLSGIGILEKAYKRASDAKIKIEKLEQKRNQIHRNYEFGKTVLKPFALSLVGPIEERLGLMVEKRGTRPLVEISGPFGLGCYYRLEWPLEDGTTANLTVSHGEGSGIDIMTGGISSGQFPGGTIGAINGFNHPTASVSTLSVDQVLETLHVR